MSTHYPSCFYVIDCSYFCCFLLCVIVFSLFVFVVQMCTWGSWIYYVWCDGLFYLSRITQRKPPTHLHLHKLLAKFYHRKFYGISIASGRNSSHKLVWRRIFYLNLVLTKLWYFWWHKSLTNLIAYPPDFR